MNHKLISLYCTIQIYSLCRAFTLPRAECS